ncbi:hypothetical protein [Chromobacterium piscinae]|uniref:hypothetical protein n=1 Tax=Chromobacterium amazonense TaxID=1382803 RepID=UPI000582B8C6|nr:hypothetical protein QR66_08390 [Chromobacterium piscinae]
MNAAHKIGLLYALAATSLAAGVWLALTSALPPALWLVGAMGAAALLVGYARQDHQLRQRMAAAEGPCWVIWCRNQPVGEIRDADYAALQHRQLHDPRLALAALGCTGRIALRQGLTAMRYLPVLACWLLLAGMLLEPNRLAEGIQASPAIWQEWAEGALVLVVSVWIYLTLWSVITYRQPMPYEEARAEALRQRCQVEGAGEVSLVPAERWRHRPVERVRG